MSVWWARRLLQTRYLFYLCDLLMVLVSRDMKLRYKRSMLGTLWTLLNPLAQLFVFNFIFRKVLPLDIPNYTAFLFTGLLVWSWFQSSLLLATSSVVDNSELVKSPGFPIAILPIVTVTSHFVHFLLAFPILLYCLISQHIALTMAVVALPLVIILQFILTLSLAYLTATLHVTFRDTQYILGIILLLAFYLTPIFYDASAIPEHSQSFYRLNPIIPLINAYRDILLYGKLPEWLLLFRLGVLASILLGFGVVIFRRASSRFVEEL